MSKPTAENIETIITGLKQFFGHMLQTKTFHLQEFINFMEPRFAAAGYRDTEKFKSQSKKNGNVLIISHAVAGDFVLQSAAIREIRRLYPGAHITLVMRASILNLAEFCPYVDELLTTNRAYLPTFLNDFWFNILFVENLLKRRFDICYAFTQSSETPFLMYMSGARIRVTQRRDNDSIYLSAYPMKEATKLATHRFPEFNYGQHTVDDNLSLVDNMVHIPCANRSIEVWYTPADYSVAASHLQAEDKIFYALCMGGSFPLKHYPPEKYARLLEMILDEEPKAMFVILGGGNRDLQSAEIIKNVAPKIYEENVIDLTNKLTYRQSAAALTLCKMYIGNDTGTMHMAAAVKCPVLSPNYFAADLPSIPNEDAIYVYSPHGVPAVVVRPEHALPECMNNRINGHITAAPRNYGCTANAPHCITQIEPETLLKGFHLLKERIAQKINEPLYIY